MPIPQRRRPIQPLKMLRIKQQQQTRQPKMRTQKPMQRTKLPGQQRQQRTPPIPKPPSQTKRPQPPTTPQISPGRGSTSHNRKVGGIGRIARRAVQNDSDRHEPRLSASHNIPKHRAETYNIRTAPDEHGTQCAVSRR